MEHRYVAGASNIHEDSVSVFGDCVLVGPIGKEYLYDPNFITGLTTLALPWLLRGHC